MKRYIPLSVLMTSIVIVAPAVLVWQVAAVHNALGAVIAIGVTVLVSMAIAHLAAALWTRHAHARDLVFADLMLWGLVRRMRIERRIREARRVLEVPPDAQTAYGPRREQRVRTFERLGELLAARDPTTLGHTRRVARHSERIARAMRLSDTEVAQVRLAAAIHDVGKVNTPREVLTKPAALTTDEFALIRRHPDDGANMVAALDDGAVTAMVRYHHERLDGSGYPAGLRGAEIPRGARIIAVADTFDAMTSRRPYRRALPHKDALDTLHAEAGVRLDADAVTAFDSYYSDHRSVAWWAAIASGPGRALDWLIATTVGGAEGRTAASAGQAALAIGGAALVLGTGAGPGGRTQPAPVPVRAAAPVHAASGSPVAFNAGAATVASSTSAAHRTSARHVAGHHPHPSHGGGSGGGGSTGGSGSTGGGGSSGGGPTSSGATKPSGGSGGSSGSSPVAVVASPVSTPPVSTPPVSTPPVSVPPVKLPSTAVKVPPVSTPPVSTPSVSTPSVTIPPVTVSPATVDPGGSGSLPSVTTPSVTVGSAKIGSITTPTVTVPSLHLP